MFNSIALDVVIGLVFIFLLYSLLSSILQEFIAKALGLRARMLVKAIARLLDDNNFENRYFDPFRDRAFTKVFYNHPNIKYLGHNNFSKKPAYISDVLFSETLIKILRTDKFTGAQNQMEIVRDALENGLITLKNYSASTTKLTLSIGPETKAGLLEMVYDSGNDLEKFKARLEQWYNEMMERAEGWYTKQTRFILFVIGIILSISFNVDSIEIVKLLSNNNIARSQIVQAAYNFKMPASNSTDTNGTELIKSAKNLINGQIDSANKVLGLGYKNSNPLNTISETSGTCLIGWILTGLAISLGAPFWFDLLQKIMAMRQAGSKPVETTEKEKISKSQTLAPNDVKNRVG